MTENLPPPSLKKTFTSPAKTAAEIYKLRGKLKEAAPHITPGDGSPVLILPGFGTGDLTSRLLRRFLNRQGYKAYGWDNGINWTLDTKSAEHLHNRLHEIARAHPGQKIALIGHSLGGIIARELAREHPSMIKQVITLGSPFGTLRHKGATAFKIREVIESLTDMGHLLDRDMADQLLTPPPVPTTSIFTRDDGIVNWQTCLNPETPETENIEVTGSHGGLIVNGTVYMVIADRLQQPDGRWQPFNKAEYPEHLTTDIKTGPLPFAPPLPDPKTFKVKSLFRPDP